MKPVTRHKQEPHEVLLSVAEAAVAWWAMKRPIPWTLEQHKETPVINCLTKDECELAQAVVEWLKISG